MIKTISKPKSKTATQKLNRQMRVTIYFGYALFALTLVGIVASAFSTLTDSYLLSWVGLNITLLLVSFVFTALAPPLVGYLVGDAATRGNSKLVHHYNGVLFGVLGVWLWLLLSVPIGVLRSNTFIDNTLLTELISIAPAALAAIATIILGIFYARSTRHQQTLIDYAPYRWTLITALAGLILCSAIAALFSLQYGSNVWMTLLINIIMPLLISLVVTLSGYWVLGEKVGTIGERVVYSLVAVGYSIVAVSIAQQLLSLFIGWGQDISGYMIAVPVIVWITYLLLLRRASR